MLKKLVILCCCFFLLSSVSISAQEFKNIEIFDPQQDKVVKVVQLNQQIRDLIVSWVKNIDGIYGKNDPATDDGYVVKVPLDPVVEVHSTILNAPISEVYILIPEKEPPFYMIFENENKLVSYRFNGDIDKLSKCLEFKLKTR